jgi:hypothetical protein
LGENHDDRRAWFEDEKEILVDRLDAANYALLKLTPSMAECVAQLRG